MSFRKGKHTGEKWCVARHRSTWTARAADALERYWERVTRAEGRAQCAEGQAEYEEGDE